VDITIFPRFFEIGGELEGGGGAKPGAFFLHLQWQEPILLAPGLAHSTRTRIIPSESTGNSSLS